MRGISLEHKKSVSINDTKDHNVSKAEQAKMMKYNKDNIYTF